MASSISSIMPNPYIYNIEDKRKRKTQLAHEIGAGAKCLKCTVKCSGFQLHFWRKVCQNCRCSKEDHDIKEQEEEFGHIFIGKLFERPIRTEEDEKTYIYGKDLEITNTKTGKKEKLKFDWIPPGVENTVAKRYMELLPPEKRPVSGSEAAKNRRKQLEQQLPLYDVDEGKRCESLPPNELKNFQKYMDNLRNEVAGQAHVKEIDSKRKSPTNSKASGRNFGPNLSKENIDQINKKFSKINVNDQPNNNALLSSREKINKHVFYPEAANQNEVKNLYNQGRNKEFPNSSKEFDNRLSPHSFKKESRQNPHDIGNLSPNNFGRLSPQNQVESESKIMHLASPKPFYARYEKPNLEKEQFCSNLTTDMNQNHNIQPQIYNTTLPTMNQKPSYYIDKSEAVQAPYSSIKEKLMYTPPMYNVATSDVQSIYPQQTRSPGQTQKINKNIQPNESYLHSEIDSNLMCQKCELLLIPGDVAVLCPRAGLDKYWHPKCFTCSTCNELLADLIYFYKDGQVFCGRHYSEEAKVPRCKACDELIFSDSWTRAEGADWHIHHFCCFMCDKELAGSKYIPDEKDIPYCYSCHMSFKAKMCEFCECKIIPTSPRAAYNGYFFHVTPNCFHCHGCKVSLVGVKFKMVKNWLFCSQNCVNDCAYEIEQNPKEKINQLQV